jgi:multidrug efflux pump subunit AcrA (membrane-fusion protein)
MEETSTDLKIYSEEVRDILSEPPKTILKWGNTILLLFFVLLLSLSYFIKYPDTISTNITLTTQTPPEKIIAKTTGSIEKILVADKTIVIAQTPLAIIKNSATFTDVFQLKVALDSLIIDSLNFSTQSFQMAQLGDIQQVYTLFEKEYIAFQNYKKLQPYSIEKSAQVVENKEQKQRLQLLIGQLSIAKTEGILKKRELDRFQKLFDKGIISAQEWETKNIEYLQHEKNIKNLQSQISQTKSSVNEQQKGIQNTTISQTKDDINLYKNVLQSLNQLKKSIADWEQIYVLRSNNGGKVSFLQLWNENQNVNQGEMVFSVISTNVPVYIGKTKATAQNSGKIKVNQTVNIRLANYPDNEFGIIKGTVKNIALTPDTEGNILIDVALPKNLETSYHKKITFQQEMTGTADIITEDLRLIERFFYQFRSVFKAN